MEDKKFNIVLPEGTKDLNILQGDYRHDELTLKKIGIHGTITAPGLHVSHLKNNNQLDTFLPVVSVNMDALTITYDGNPREKYADVVKGELTLEKSTLDLGIN